jgi:hypothetical protein
MGLKRSPLCLVSTIEELLERKSIGSCLESRKYGLRDPVTLTWHRLSATVGTTSPTSGGRSIGIVRSRTHAMEFSLVAYIYLTISRKKLFLRVASFSVYYYNLFRGAFNCNSVFPNVYFINITCSGYVILIKTFGKILLRLTEPPKRL